MGEGKEREEKGGEGGEGERREGEDREKEGRGCEGKGREGKPVLKKGERFSAWVSGCFYFGDLCNLDI